MAHERGDVRTTPGLVPGRDASAEELQRLLRAKRESITQTVEEIKMTMHSGYQDTRTQVSQTFDWRFQMQQHPLAAVGGALAVGFLAGQVLGRMMSHETGHGGRSLSGSSRSRILTSTSSFGAGRSLAPESGSVSGGTSSMEHHREPRHFIPPAVKSRVGGRFEEVLSDMAENVLSELSRVGREVLVPTIVAGLTNAITSRGGSMGMGSGMSGGMGSGTRGGQQRSSYSPKSTTESSTTGFSGTSGSHGTAAGGPINQSGEDQSSGNRFQGRGI